MKYGKSSLFFGLSIRKEAESTNITGFTSWTQISVSKSCITLAISIRNAIFWRICIRTLSELAMSKGCFVYVFMYNNITNPYAMSYLWFQLTWTYFFSFIYIVIRVWKNIIKSQIVVYTYDVSKNIWYTNMLYMLTRA